MKIGTRESKLALKQTDIFISRLIGTHEIVKVNTSGDINKDSPLGEIGGSGLFVDGLNEMVLKEELDCAVHSGKDLPSQMNEELYVSSVFDWTHFHDVIIYKNGLDITKIKNIGTSSPRRIAQVSKNLRNIETKNIRGNVDTRLKKLDNGEYDAIIMSEAAVFRMFPEREHELLPESTFVPAANQGIISVVSRKDSKHATLFKNAEDKISRKRWDMERAIANILEMGCSTPNGIFYDPLKNMAYIDINKDSFTLTSKLKVTDISEVIEFAKKVRKDFL
jgi:hydroxymethylbilane synthase